MTRDDLIGLRIDQTLAQDATGTLEMLALGALKLPHMQTELSVQYVDHKLFPTDDHLFLQYAATRFGL
ncbi:hypothetical protein [uncultured Sulfitobacter sp.]|uniref:hypothetical protein n=1 Tax=uncultured Sulfitobacter sp. TaxID=191468 RepID=UPI00260E833F|nr:hypothetical protein [uncultured Sulfitobacter sp.]